MNGRSSFPSPRFSGGTPRNEQQYGRKQPYYLPPNCNFLSPRGSGSRISSPRNSSGSPDFIPLGVSSPVGRVRNQWNHRSFSNTSSFSGMSTPPSSESSPSFTPYRRNNFRGKNRGGKHRNSNDNENPPNILLYLDRSALQNPWAELENNLRRGQPSPPQMSQCGSQDFVPSTADLDSEDEEGSGSEAEESYD